MLYDKKARSLRDKLLAGAEEKPAKKVNKAVKVEGKKTTNKSKKK